ncbi:MAG TPA: carboxypeptidase-like regulatory domain-containing protein, partial [Bryobacteraceae bacterium]|nr:carboxypeptidase-like regulatory domain-containing protein [Bryobacteraceae bacterium]
WPRLFAAILLAAPALAQQPAPPAAEEATGSIEGTVLDAVTGEPIRKAEVNLNGAAPPGGAQTDLRAGTDASGHFAFRALPAGAYWLHAQHANYAYASAEGPARIALETGEQKSGIEIKLSPQGTISGKVVDEFEAPVANCFVSALRRQSQNGRRSLVSRNGVATNDRGEYWIQGLEKGRYYVAARCGGELEAPHALMPLHDPRRPTLVYAPQFYPGVADTNGATRLAVTPGTETQGVDFQVHRVTGVTVRVRVDAPDPSVLQNGNVQVLLLPPNLDLFETGGLGASLDRRTGEFQIRSVTPGSYVILVSTGVGNPPFYQGRLPLQVGATAPDPLHVVVAPASEMSGTVEVEGDNPPPLEGLSVMLEPLNSLPFPRPPQAHVNKDGTFTVTGLTPGRWRLLLWGGPYIKSLAIGERDASPFGFDLAPGTAGPIHILASGKTGQVQAAVSATFAGEPINFLLVPAEPERLDGGLVRASPGGTGQAMLQGVVPGRYRLYAFNAPPQWNLQELPEVLGALENRAQLIEVGEGQTVQVTAEPIEASQLKEALDENQ